MSTIRNILIHQGQIKKLTEQDELKQVRTQTSHPDKSTDLGKSSQGTSDTVNISATGKNLLTQKAEINAFAVEMTQVSTINPERLAQIKDRIDSHYYDNPEITDRIAQGIVANETAAAAAVEANEQPAESKEDPMAAIKERIEQRYYDQSEVVDLIAKRMLNTDKS